jgi:hypothetical protein
VLALGKTLQSVLIGTNGVNSVPKCNSSLKKELQQLLASKSPYHLPMQSQISHRKFIHKSFYHQALGLKNGLKGTGQTSGRRAFLVPFSAKLGFSDVLA